MNTEHRISLSVLVDVLSQLVKAEELLKDGSAISAGKAAAAIIGARVNLKVALMGLPVTIKIDATE